MCNTVARSAGGVKEQITKTNYSKSQSEYRIGIRNHKTITVTEFEIEIKTESRSDLSTKFM